MGSGLWRDLPDTRRLFLAKAFTLLFTVLQALVAIGAFYGGFAETIVHQALAIAGFSAGLLLGLFLVALVIGAVPSLQANAGLVFGAAIITYIAFWTPLSGYWYSLVCSVSVFAMTSLLWSLTVWRARPAPVASVQEES